MHKITVYTFVISMACLIFYDFNNSSYGNAVVLTLCLMLIIFMCNSYDEILKKIKLVYDASENYREECQEVLDKSNNNIKILLQEKKILEGRYISIMLRGIDLIFVKLVEKNIISFLEAKELSKEILDCITNDVKNPKKSM